MLELWHLCATATGAGNSPYIVARVKEQQRQTPLTLPTCPMEGLEGHGYILVPPGVCGSWPLLAVWGPAVFLGSPPTHNTHLVPPGVCGLWRLHFGPSWSVRLLAAPHSMGPAVFLGSPPTLNTHLVPPGVCDSWPLLAVCGSWPASMGPAVFLGSPPTHNNTHLVPPGVCGSWPLPRSMGPAVCLGSPAVFPQAHRQPTTPTASIAG